MNDLVIHRQQEIMTAGDVRSHVNLIQEVMQSVMKADTHYGVIPGAKKPSLYKAGSEVLLTTFRIAVSLRVEDLSDSDCIRYRVYATGTHQNSGIVIGEGIGECSTSEEKYRWRAAICQEEFDDTPENMRRIKYSKYNNKVEKKQQIRTNPSDLANTVLKMAKKRAQIDLTLTSMAASDIFTQDIEDLPEELRERDEIRKGAGAAAAESAKQKIVIAPELLAAQISELETVCKTKGRESFRDAWKKVAPDMQVAIGIPERNRIDSIASVSVPDTSSTPEEVPNE